MGILVFITHINYTLHTHKSFQASVKLQEELINNSSVPPLSTLQGSCNGGDWLTNSFWPKKSIQHCLVPAKSICRFYCDHCVLSNQMHHKIPDRLQWYICWYVWFGGWWPIKQPWQICASQQANRTWTMLMHNIMEWSYFYFPALVSYRSWNAVIWMEQTGFAAANLLLFSEGFSSFTYIYSLARLYTSSPQNRVPVALDLSPHLTCLFFCGCQSVLKWLLFVLRLLVGLNLCLCLDHWVRV